MHFNFRAFRAIDDLKTCLLFKEEHRNVLRDYGVTNITTNSEAWMYNPDIYCIVAESGVNKRVLGGVRLQVSRYDAPLPIELALAKHDGAVSQFVGGFREMGGVAELCALWNAKAVAGSGLSVLLVRAGVAFSVQLPIKFLVTICADFTLKMFTDCGFTIQRSLNDGKGYPYPNRSYLSRVLAVNDLADLRSAEDHDRERILSIRKEPTQVAREQTPGSELNVDYNLFLTH
jgi:hypothetical protein